jgi:hypothetical protein
VHPRNFRIKPIVLAASAGVHRLMRCRGDRAAALALLGALLFTACTGRGSSPRQTGTLKLSEAEFRYGVSPRRDPKVVYQDDVVLFEHGAEAVHSVSADGLTWTIDADIPHADEIKPGKIIFLTNRGVGRVLGIQRHGGELGVVLGPITLTDVIKEAELQGDQPVDLDQMIKYTAPDFPGAVFYTPPTVVPAPPSKSELEPGNGASVRLASYAYSGGPAAPPGRLPQPVQGPPGPLSLDDFKVYQFCCRSLGLKLVHDRNGLQVTAQAQLHLKAPSLRFNIIIHNSQIQTAELELRGAAGLTLEFEATSTSGIQGNINKQIWIPCDWEIGVGGLNGVPLAIAFHQGFILKTAFSARNSVLKARGDYAFSGSIQMGYHNGSWQASAPAALIVNQSLMDSLSGASLGITAFEIAYQGRVMVGIGAFGFVTGPYLGYVAAVGISRGSDAAGLLVGRTCKGAILNVDLQVGVGYSIPRPVTDVINFILRSFNLREIQGTGGLPPIIKNVFKKTGDLPVGCAGYPASP